MVMDPPVVLAPARRLAVSLPALAIALSIVAQRAPAQDADSGAPSDSVHAAPLFVPYVARTAVAGAAGTWVLGAPKAWARTPAGLGKRVADQAGLYTLQVGGERLLLRGMGWHHDGAPCRERSLVRLAACATARTAVARDGGGVRRANVPLLGSVVAATAVSLAWRPERGDAAEGRLFIGTRVGVVLAGYVAERFVLEWWQGRKRQGGERGHSPPALRTSASYDDCGACTRRHLPAKR